MDTEIEVLKKRTEINTNEDRTVTEHEQTLYSLPPRFDPNAAWVKEQFPNGDVTFF